MATLTNTAPGPRGAYNGGVLAMIEPGQTVDLADMTADELTNATEAGYFTVEGGAAKAAKASDPDDPTAELDAMSVAQLTALAAEKGVTVPTEGTGANGRVLKADIIAAIEAGPPADGVDAMSDDELRATVLALTGTEPAADATRDDLIAAVRS